MSTNIRESMDGACSSSDREDKRNGGDIPPCAAPGFRQARSALPRRPAAIFSSSSPSSLSSSRASAAASATAGPSRFGEAREQQSYATPSIATGIELLPPSSAAAMVAGAVASKAERAAAAEEDCFLIELEGDRSLEAEIFSSKSGAARRVKKKWRNVGNEAQEESPDAADAAKKEQKEEENGLGESLGAAVGSSSRRQLPCSTRWIGARASSAVEEQAAEWKQICEGDSEVADTYGLLQQRLRRRLLALGALRRSSRQPVAAAAAPPAKRIRRQRPWSKESRGEEEEQQQEHVTMVCEKPLAQGGLQQLSTAQSAAPSAAAASSARGLAAEAEEENSALLATTHADAEKEAAAFTAVGPNGAAGKQAAAEERWREEEDKEYEEEANRESRAAIEEDQKADDEEEQSGEEDLLLQTSLLQDIIRTNSQMQAQQAFLRGSAICLFSSRPPPRARRYFFAHPASTAITTASTNTTPIAIGATTASRARAAAALFGFEEGAAGDLRLAAAGLQAAAATTLPAAAAVIITARKEEETAQTATEGAEDAASKADSAYEETPSEDNSSTGNVASDGLPAARDVAPAAAVCVPAAREDCVAADVPSPICDVAALDREREGVQSEKKEGKKGEAARERAAAAGAAQQGKGAADEEGGGLEGNVCVADERAMKGEKRQEKDAVSATNEEVKEEEEAETPAEEGDEDTVVARTADGDYSFTRGELEAHRRFVRALHQTRKGICYFCGRLSCPRSADGRITCSESRCEHCYAKGHRSCGRAQAQRSDFFHLIQTRYQLRYSFGHDPTNEDQQQRQQQQHHAGQRNAGMRIPPDLQHVCCFRCRRRGHFICGPAPAKEGYASLAARTCADTRETLAKQNFIPDFVWSLEAAAAYYAKLPRHVRRYLQEEEETEEARPSASPSRGVGQRENVVPPPPPPPLLRPPHNSSRHAHPAAAAAVPAWPPPTESPFSDSFFPSCTTAAAAAAAYDGGEGRGAFLPGHGAVPWRQVFAADADHTYNSTPAGLLQVVSGGVREVWAYQDPPHPLLPLPIACAASAANAVRREDVGYDERQASSNRSCRSNTPALLRTPADRGVFLHQQQQQQQQRWWRSATGSSTSHCRRAEKRVKQEEGGERRFAEQQWKQREEFVHQRQRYHSTLPVSATVAASATNGGIQGGAAATARNDGGVTPKRSWRSGHAQSFAETLYNHVRGCTDEQRIPRALSTSEPSPVLQQQQHPCNPVHYPRVNVQQQQEQQALMPQRYVVAAAAAAAEDEGPRPLQRKPGVTRHQSPTRTHPLEKTAATAAAPCEKKENGWKESPEFYATASRRPVAVSFLHATTAGRNGSRSRRPSAHAHLQGLPLLHSPGSRAARAAAAANRDLRQTGFRHTVAWEQEQQREEQEWRRSVAHNRYMSVNTQPVQTYSSAAPLLGASPRDVVSRGHVGQQQQQHSQGQQAGGAPGPAASFDWSSSYSVEIASAAAPAALHHAIPAFASEYMLQRQVHELESHHISSSRQGFFHQRSVPLAFDACVGIQQQQGFLPGVTALNHRRTYYR